jgi:hypothetical protein
MPLVLWLSVVVCAIGATFDTTTMAFAFVQNAATTTDLLSSMAPRIRRNRQVDLLEVSSLCFFSPSAMSLSSTQNQQSDDDSTSNNTAKKKTGPDLFEFFDPLLSPHAYPEGVSPEKKPIAQNNDEIQMQQQQQFRKDIEQSQQETKKMFGIQLPSPSDTTTSTSTIEKESDGEKKGDLFDYFDPLMSPHSYPDGVKPSTMSTTTTPPPLEVVGNEDSSSSSSSSSSGGDSDSSSNKHRKKIGVLLMDHGSKKEKSNARLQAMAKLYQMTSNGVDDYDDDGTSTEPTIIVRAAHMEIATPSIHDGLKALKDLGVDEIICHPFFLSADGRHVKEDIPEIIGVAIEDLWGENSGATPIPIVTTAPVGSNTQLMLGAIHSLVRENSRYLKTTSN